MKRRVPSRVDGVTRGPPADDELSRGLEATPGAHVEQCVVVLTLLADDDDVHRRPGVDEGGGHLLKDDVAERPQGQPQGGLASRVLGVEVEERAGVKDLLEHGLVLVLHRQVERCAATQIAVIYQ